jgi:hypothetical protein
MIVRVNTIGARIIRASRQSEFLRHAEDLERWATVREHAITPPVAQAVNRIE